jgi:hypothetical protein
MEGAPFKKVITVGGQEFELYSLDGIAWSSDLGQLRAREIRRAKLMPAASTAHGSQKSFRQDFCLKKIFSRIFFA